MQQNQFYTSYKTHEQNQIISECAGILSFLYLEQFHLCKLAQQLWQRNLFGFFLETGWLFMGLILQEME